MNHIEAKGFLQVLQEMPEARVAQAIANLDNFPPELTGQLRVVLQQKKLAAKTIQALFAKLPKEERRWSSAKEAISRSVTWLKDHPTFTSSLVLSGAALMLDIGPNWLFFTLVTNGTLTYTILN